MVGGDVCYFWNFIKDITVLQDDVYHLFLSVWRLFLQAMNIFVKISFIVGGSFHHLLPGHP